MILEKGCILVTAIRSKIKLRRQRYKEKVTSYLCGQDPYELPMKDWENDIDLWPSVTYVDIGMYLLFSNSPYTQDQLKDYKNLDCYQKFANESIRAIYVKKLPDQTLVLIGKVCMCIKLSSKCPSAQILVVMPLVMQCQCP